MLDPSDVAPGFHGRSHEVHLADAVPQRARPKVGGMETFEIVGSAAERNCPECGAIGTVSLGVCGVCYMDLGERQGSSPHRAAGAWELASVPDEYLFRAAD